LTTPTQPPIPTQIIKPAPWRPQVRTPYSKGEQRASALVQGPAGTGKTHFLSTWPNPFFLVFDVNTGTHERLGVPHVVVKDWAEVERYWLRALNTRSLSSLIQSIETEDGSRPYADYQVKTLCVDSITFFANGNVLELGRGGSRDMGFMGWDTYYARLHKLLDAGLKATKSDRPGEETYHFVASIHEDTKTNDAGQIVAILPAIQGKMASHFLSYFDCQFLTKVRSEGGLKCYYLTTLPEGPRQNSKGDTIGGPGALPPLVPNSYQDLAKAWGWEDR